MFTLNSKIKHGIQSKCHNAIVRKVMKTILS